MPSLSGLASPMADGGGSNGDGNGNRCSGTSLHDDDEASLVQLPRVISEVGCADKTQTFN